MRNCKDPIGAGFRSGVLYGKLQIITGKFDAHSYRGYTRRRQAAHARTSH